MAIALEHHPVSRARRAGGFAPLFRSVLDRLLAAWQRYRIERELEGLSFDQRKDIGFRSSDKTTR